MNKLKKELILGFTILILSVFFWWFIKSIFYINNLSLTCWIFGIILFILWGVSLCLSMLLIEDKRILYGSFFASLVSFVFFFNNEPFYYLIVLILLFFSFLIAIKKIRKQEKIQVNLSYWKIWKPGFSFLITFLIIVISLIYYFSPSLMEMEQFEFKISRNAFNTIIKPLEGLISKKLPQGIDLDVNVSNFLEGNEIFDLKSKYGIIVDDQDTSRDVLYNLVNYQLNNVTGPYRKFIPFGLAVGLFIILKIVSILYVGLVLLFSWLILQLLLTLGFINKEFVKKEVETVKL